MKFKKSDSNSLSFGEGWGEEKKEFSKTRVTISNLN
jgi:hypothetical protein